MEAQLNFWMEPKIESFHLHVACAIHIILCPSSLMWKHKFTSTALTCYSLLTFVKFDICIYSSKIETGHSIHVHSLSSKTNFFYGKSLDIYIHCFSNCSAFSCLPARQLTVHNAELNVSNNLENY